MAHANFRQRVKKEGPAHIQKITEIAGNIAHAVVIKEGDIFFLSQPDGDEGFSNVIKGSNQKQKQSGTC
jgi:hypothetical protein